MPVSRGKPKRRTPASESGAASPEDDVVYHWKHETELVDTSVRGSSIFLLDPSSCPSARDREPHDEKQHAHELMNRWMQGRVDACSSLLHLCSGPGAAQAREACDTWRKQLALRTSVGLGSSLDARRDDEVGGSVRLDASCIDFAQLLVHNSRKIKGVTTKFEPPALRNPSFPPPPVAAGIREEERVVPLGKSLLLLAHVTWEPSTRGRRLVAIAQTHTKCMCVYGSEEEAVTRLRSELRQVHVLSVLLAATGLASLAAAAAHRSRRV